MARPVSTRNRDAMDYRGPYAGCWEWTGSTNDSGYGTLYRPPNPALLHRRVYEAIFGPIPDDLCVLHRCDNPPCFRPDHLFLGTIGDNNRDMRDKGRHWCLARETCGKGHRWTPDTTSYQTSKSGQRRRVCLLCLRDRSVATVKRRNEGRDDLLCPAGFRRHRYLGADVCFKCGEPRPQYEPTPRSPELREEIARKAARARWQR